MLGVLVALVVPLAPAQAFDDSDGDGLDDGLEDVLASQFFPWVWFDSGENYGCTEPATPWNLGTAVARVRPHPGDGAKIAISYAILYRRDCGGNDHCSESFTLEYNVFNAGEDYARRFDELSAYQFPGEYAWSAVPFSGSLSRSSNAGLVRDKLLDDRLLAPRLVRRGRARVSPGLARAW